MQSTIFLAYFVAKAESVMSCDVVSRLEGPNSLFMQYLQTQHITQQQINKNNSKHSDVEHVNMAIFIDADDGDDKKSLCFICCPKNR